MPTSTQSKAKLRPYYAEGETGWFVVLAQNMGLARECAGKEFGRGSKHKVRAATPSEAKGYASWRGFEKTYPPRAL